MAFLSSPVRCKKKRKRGKFEKAEENEKKKNTERSLRENKHLNSSCRGPSARHRYGKVFCSFSISIRINNSFALAMPVVEKPNTDVTLDVYFGTVIKNGFFDLDSTSVVSKIVIIDGFDDHAIMKWNCAVRMTV